MAIHTWPRRALLTLLCLLQCASWWPAGCHARGLQQAAVQQQAGGAAAHQQQHQLLAHSDAAAYAAPHLQQPFSSSSRRHAWSHQQQQQQRRALRQYKPSPHEQHDKHAGRLSAWHAAGVGVLSLLAMAVLAFIAHKAMQWLERTRRPGYVELQALDGAFHRPTFTL